MRTLLHVNFYYNRGLVSYFSGRKRTPLRGIEVGISSVICIAELDTSVSTLYLLHGMIFHCV
jgi:hypothetical protein